MVRPSTAGWGHGGFSDVEKLRVAGLARAIQTKLYLHSCSNKYCLQGRSTCRFFFPWPETPQQQYCLNTERVAGQRRLEEDDAWLNPHELYLAMFSPATVHCLPFDPKYGSDTARQYCGKYASKPEKWFRRVSEGECAEGGSSTDGQQGEHVKKHGRLTIMLQMFIFHYARRNPALGLSHLLAPGDGFTWKVPEMVVCGISLRLVLLDCAWPITDCSDFALYGILDQCSLRPPTLFPREITELRVMLSTW